MIPTFPLQPYYANLDYLLLKASLPLVWLIAIVIIYLLQLLDNTGTVSLEERQNQQYCTISITS